MWWLELLGLEPLQRQVRMQEVPWLVVLIP